MKQKVSNYCQNLVKKYKGTEIKCSPVYFNSTTKTVINHNLILTNLFKKFCTELITGLMKDLVGLLNQLNLNTLIIQLLDYYGEVPT